LPSKAFQYNCILVLVFNSFAIPAFAVVTDEPYKYMK
jgi:hypothetical protein